MGGRDRYKRAAIIKLAKDFSVFFMQLSASNSAQNNDQIMSPFVDATKPQLMANANQENCFPTLCSTVEPNNPHSVQLTSVIYLDGLLSKAQAVGFQRVFLRSILLSFLHAVQQVVEYQDYISFL